MSSDEEKISSRLRLTDWFKWRLLAKARRQAGDEPTDFQKQEMAALAAGYDEFKKALVEDVKARNYLVQRAIPFELAQMTGGAYVPWDRRKEPGLSAFADRIIFPYTPCGFIGRALHGWEPGMTEAQHRQKLTAKKIAPYWRTHAGNFILAPPGMVCVTVEGVFDGLSLLAAGLDRDGVLVTTSPIFVVENLPEHIKIVVLAMDGDKVGKKAAEFMAERLTRAGIHVIACIPPDDGLGKDWNERWQKARGDSLAPVLDAYQSALALGREYDIQT